MVKCLNHSFKEIIMADMRSWPHKFISEFIELYKSLPCLYNIKSKQYSNKQLKNAAYSQLVEKLKELDRDATKDTVKKKINNMRSSYRKELKKIMQTEKNGLKDGEIYEPSLWYFHQLDFLYDQEVPQTSMSSISNMESSTEDIEITKCEPGGDEPSSWYYHQLDFRYDHEIPRKSLSSISNTENSTKENEINLGNDNASQSESLDQRTLSPFTPPSISAGSSSYQDYRSNTGSKMRNQQIVNNQDIVLDLESRRLQKQSKFSHYGAYVADELSDLLPMTATICQKLINDVLFEAKCGTLNRGTRIVTEPETTNMRPYTQ